jgi:RsmE family RNA methyltransferase
MRRAVNVILLEEGERVNGGTFRVGGARARHVREVLRAEPGRTLRVGLLDGPLGAATVLEAGPESALLACAFEAEAPPRPPTDLVLAVPRPKSLARLLPEAAALGIDRLVLLRTWRVAKPYLATALVRDPAARRPLLLDGLMQARDTRLPAVSLEPLFRPWVEDRAPALASGARAFVAHPDSARDLALERLSPGERAVLAVGPEGGFTLYEVSALARAGFRPVSLGARTLRVETAVTAALALLDALRRQAAPVPPSAAP